MTDGIPTVGVGAGVDACDLLAAGRCTARCLLAMSTPAGWVGCTCICGGLYHAALIDAAPRPVAEIRDATGATLGVRPALRAAS